MATAARYIAGPLKLQTLLSSLPNNGRLSVVRKAKAKHLDHVYLVTRTKLKFVSIAPVEAPVAKVQKIGTKAAPKPPVEHNEYESKSPMEGGRLRARGKVWAMEFHRSKLALAHSANESRS
jgi:hypothetical protein